MTSKTDTPLRTEADLKPHQRRAIDYIISNPFAGLFLGMGFGKTAIALHAIRKLKNAGLVNKVGIVAPKRTALFSWPQEIESWAETKDLTYTSLLGEGKFTKAMASARDTDLYIVNRENIIYITRVYENFKETNNPLDMLIIDESSLFKNSSSVSFKELKQIIPLLKRRVIMTGTPTPNNEQQLWSQIYILDEGAALGRNISEFRKQFCYAHITPKYTKYEVKPNEESNIRNKIRHLIFAIDNKDLIDLPDISYVNIFLPLSPQLQQGYNELKRGLGIIIDGKEFLPVNASQKLSALLQFASGEMYRERFDKCTPKHLIDSEEYKKPPELTEDTADKFTPPYHIHSIKLKKLFEIIEYEAQTNVLVVIRFKHEKRRILNAFAKERIEVLGDGDKKDKETIKKWNEGNLKILLVSPQQAAHGLNLQHGGALCVWYSLTYDLELYQQLNKRLHRQGQKAPVKIVHITTTPIELRILELLQKKEIKQNELLNELAREIQDETFF